ncbi:hypothetical protein BDV93DRAFT_563745 [Ceratobasidium sp. AG-I]|nr:hypothetical protein BDV93DRAFT_563745 [Ceratobasidium sp. AG-I]
MQKHWNSTGLTLEGTDRTWDGCIEYQQNSRFTPHKQCLNPEDCMPLHQATKEMSKAGLPLLAGVIPQFNMLTKLYSRFANNKNSPLYMCYTADHVQCVLNKFYSKTDNSTLYCLALLCHPSLHVHYMKMAKWEQDWIDTAVELAESCWNEHYNLLDQAAQDSVAGYLENASQFGLSVNIVFRIGIL